MNHLPSVIEYVWKLEEIKFEFLNPIYYENMLLFVQEHNILLVYEAS